MFFHFWCTETIMAGFLKLIVAIKVDRSRLKNDFCASGVSFIFNSLKNSLKLVCGKIKVLIFFPQFPSLKQIVNIYLSEGMQYLRIIFVCLARTIFWFIYFSFKSKVECLTNIADKFRKLVYKVYLVEILRINFVYYQIMYQMIVYKQLQYYTKYFFRKYCSS